MKKYKALILLNVLLTVLATSVWGYVWYEENNNDTEQAEVTKRDESTKKLNENFGLIFDSESIVARASLTEEDTEDLDIPEEELAVSVNAEVVLEGSTEGVKEVLLVVSYDPKLVEVSDIVEGDLFDAYDSKEIDSELGLIKLKGVMNEDKTLTEGTFATIEFSKLKDEEASLIIIEDDLVVDSFTTVTDFEGNKTTVKSSQVAVY